MRPNLEAWRESERLNPAKSSNFAIRVYYIREMPTVVDISQRRSEFVRAAWSVATSEGLASVTVRRIAASSGHSVGAVQRAFSTQDALHRSLKSELIARNSERLRAAFQPKIAADRLTALLPVEASRKTELLLAEQMLHSGYVFIEYPEAGRRCRTDVGVFCDFQFRASFTRPGLKHPGDDFSAARIRLRAVFDGLTSLLLDDSSPPESRPTESMARRLLHQALIARR